jgi:chromosome segregation ATPase
MSRKRAILIAGIMTAAVLVTLVVLNVEGLAARLVPAPKEATAEEEAANANIAASEAEAYVESLQAHREELASAIAAMEAREAEYQQQLEAAKQTIAELEASIDELEAQTEADNANLADYESQLEVANNIAWELRSTAEAWQAREAQYSAQIEDANRTILGLQAEIQQLTGQQVAGQ